MKHSHNTGKTTLNVNGKDGNMNKYNTSMAHQTTEVECVGTRE